MPYEGPEKFDAMANAESAKKKDFVPATKTLQNKLVKARDVTRHTRIEASSAWDLGGVNFCCPRNRPVQDYVTRAGIRDTLLRVSCSMDKQEFFDKFIREA